MEQTFKLMLSDCSISQQHDFNIPSSYFQQGEEEKVIMKTCSISIRNLKSQGEKRKISQSPQKKHKPGKCKTLPKQKLRTYEDYAILVPEEVEEELVNYMRHSCEICYVRIRKEIPFFVEHLLNRCQLQLSHKDTLFDNSNVPPKTWTENFIKGNSKILDSLNVYDIDFCGIDFLLDNFKKSFSSYAKGKGLHKLREIFLKKDWSHIYFCGDVQLETYCGKTSNMNAINCQTVFFCVPGFGQPLKPLVVNRGFLNKNFETSMYADNKYHQAASSDGTATSEVFHVWLTNHFQTHNGNEPAIIFFNAQAPYISVPVLDFGKENNIFFFCIPPVLSGNLDILDSYCFPALQEKYTELLQKKYQDSRLRKVEEFSPLLLVAAMDITNFESTMQQVLEKSDWIKIFQQLLVSFGKDTHSEKYVDPKLKVSHKKKFQKTTSGCQNNFKPTCKLSISTEKNVSPNTSPANRTKTISNILGKIQGLDEATTIISSTFPKQGTNSADLAVYYDKIMDKLTRAMDSKTEEYRRLYEFKS